MKIGEFIHTYAFRITYLPPPYLTITTHEPALRFSDLMCRLTDMSSSTSLPPSSMRCRKAGKTSSNALLILELPDTYSNLISSLVCSLGNRTTLCLDEPPKNLLSRTTTKKRPKHPPSPNPHHHRTRHKRKSVANPHAYLSTKIRMSAKRKTKMKKGALPRRKRRKITSTRRKRDELAYAEALMYFQR